jgi:hypothetical protein
MAIVVLVAIADTSIACRWTVRWSLSTDPARLRENPLEFGLQCIWYICFSLFSPPRLVADSPSPVSCTISIHLNHLFYARRVFSASLHRNYTLVALISIISTALLGTYTPADPALFRLSLPSVHQVSTSTSLGTL